MAMAGLESSARISAGPAQGCGRARAARQGPPHQCDPLLPRSGCLRRAGGEGHSGARAAADPRIDLSASGCPAAAPARRPIPSPCSSWSRSRPRNAMSSCRFSPPTSTRTAWHSPATASTRTRSRPTWRRRGSPASSPRRATATRSFASCARRSCSRARACWPTHRSRASISSPAATCSST